jgi:hypothetical protein
MSEEYKSQHAVLFEMTNKIVLQRQLLLPYQAVSKL